MYGPPTSTAVTSITTGGTDATATTVNFGCESEFLVEIYTIAPK